MLMDRTDKVAVIHVRRGEGLFGLEDMKRRDYEEGFARFYTGDFPRSKKRLSPGRNCPKAAYATA
jgi:hypothetical protein